MPEIFVSKNPKPVSEVKLPQKPQSVNKNPLSAFMFMPEGITFENQEPNETIVLFLRKHFITNLPWIFLSLILLLIPVTLFPFMILNEFIPQLPPETFRLIFTVWFLFVFNFILN